MQILESLVRSKAGDPSLGDDLIVINDNFVAVIDGVSSPIEGSGQLAAQLVQGALESLHEDASIEIAFDEIAAHVLDGLKSKGLTDPVQERPAAVAAIFSRCRSEVWRVCDPNVRINGRDKPSQETPVGQIATAFRSVLLQAYIEEGVAMDELIVNDPSQMHTRALSKHQKVFRNHPTSRWGFGVFDGTNIPARYIECFPVETGDRVVLASDGYPQVFDSLRESEEALKAGVEADPLTIFKHQGWRAVTSEMESFDDRAYVSFIV